MECEGKCEEHVGQVKCVWVYNSVRDWGPFNYCEAAIEHDLKQGFTVAECCNNEVVQEIQK